MPPQLHTIPANAPRAIGYIRVSIAREEMISPELQESAITDYCKHKGYILKEIIQDLDATGRNFARVGIQRAIEQVEKSDIDVVVVWKFSRFGRSRKGWAINLDRVESVGGRLESATEQLDTTTSAGRFGRGILGELAAFESDRIGEGWQEAHANRAQNGLPHDGKPRFGYLYHRTTVKTRDGVKNCPQGCGMGECETAYLPDPVLSLVAAELYDRYNAGVSYRTLAIHLNESKIPTTRGEQWDPRGVRRYLHSGFAAGLNRTHPGTCTCKTPHSCKNSRFEPGAHQAIIEPDVWEAYRRNSKRRATYAPRVESPAYPLTGLVFCSKCGGPMNVHSKTLPKRGYIRGYVYFCARNTRARQCPGTSMVRARLEERVYAWVCAIAAAPVDERSETVRVRQAAKVATKDTRKQLLQEWQSLAEALTRLTVSHAKGLVPEAAYVSARDEMEADQAKIDKVLAEQEAEDEGPAGPPVQAARDLAAAWPVLLPAQKREMLFQLVDRITVTSIRQGVADVEASTTWGEIVPL